MYSLPYAVEIDGESYKIRNNCDYKVILDVIEALNDQELTEEEQLKCALYVFYGDEINRIKNFDEALKQMFIVINGGIEEQKSQNNEPKLMDWHKDFSLIAPPINRVLGYDFRTPEKFTHWWTLIGAYGEIGDCSFANIVSIRSKRAKRKPLEKWEREFYEKNKELIDLPQNLSKEEQEFLDDDW